MAIAVAWLNEGESEVQLAAADGSNDPFCVMVPEQFVEVVEDFNREDLTWIREGFIGEIPVMPEWKVDAVQVEHGLCVPCTGGHIRWVELRSEDLERRENAGRSSWLMSKGVAEFLVHGHCKVRCLPSDTGEGCCFWGVYNACDQQCETVLYIAG